jgi:hypothetical protein
MNPKKPFVENFEIYTANGQYNKDAIIECFKEISIALKLSHIEPLTACQKLVLVMLQEQFENFTNEHNQK